MGATQPRSHVIRPRLDAIHQRILELDALALKLVRRDWFQGRFRYSSLPSRTEEAVSKDDFIDGQPRITPSRRPQDKGLAVCTPGASLVHVDAREIWSLDLPFSL